jgi:hypothetical protein
MKVFISSVISGFEEYRDIAAAAARSLGHEVIRAEDFGSSPDSPQRTCLGGVREADVVVLLLGGSYGAVQSSGLSATHEEYVEARTRCPVIVLVEEGVTRERAQEAFIADVRDWAEGHYTEGFADIDSLRNAVVGSLHRIELARATGPVDSNEMLQRAIDLLPSDRQNIGAVLTVVVTGGPLQSVLRPAELEDKELSQRLHKEALFGQVPVLNAKDGTETLIEGDSLSLQQKGGRVTLNEQGSMIVKMMLESPVSGLPVIIEEEVRDGIRNALVYCSWVLDQIDTVGRISHCAIVVEISDGYMGWRTRSEHMSSPNQVSVPMAMGSGEHQPVHLSPPHRARAALRLESDRLAEDLTVLLRRRWQG